MSLVDIGTLPLQGVVPLVLHRIVRDTPVFWEDVQEKRLQAIIAHIGQYWAVFSNHGVMNRARWMLTFDDGSASDYEIVFPLLCEAGISATFFVVTNHIGKKGYLNWAQIKEMHRHGMCIGSHSVSHRRLTKLDDEQVMEEFEYSKRMIEERICDEVLAFSYPFGTCDSRLHAIGFSAGYSYLCTSAHGVVSPGARILPRNSVHSAMDMKAIVRLMEPTVGTRFCWRAEEILKLGTKRLIGEERYRRLRDSVLL